MAIIISENATENTFYCVDLDEAIHFGLLLFTQCFARPSTRADRKMQTCVVRGVKKELTVTDHHWYAFDVAGILKKQVA